MRERGQGASSFRGSRRRPGKPTPPPPPPPPAAGAGGAAGNPLKLGRRRSVRDPGPPPPLLPALTRSRCSLTSPPPAAPGPQPGPPSARPHLPRADKRTLPPSRAPPPNSGARPGPSRGRGRPETPKQRPGTPPRSWAAPRAPPVPLPGASQSFPKCQPGRGGGARGPRVRRPLHVARTPPPSAQSWRTMSPGRHRPALSPHGCGGAAPSAAPAPTSRPPRREGSPGQLCTKRQGPHCRAVPRVPAQLPAQRGPARSARGAAHERPPPDKGASAGPEGRAWAVRRVALAPPCVPAPRGACATRALADAACAEPAVPAAASGGLGPARYARGRRRCLIFLRRETCSAPRPRAGHAHSRPHPRPAPRPARCRRGSLRSRGGASSQSAGRPPARPQKATGVSRWSSKPGSGGTQRSVGKRRGESAGTIFQRGGVRDWGAQRP